MKKIATILFALCLLLTSCLALAEEGAALPMGDPVWLYDDLDLSIYLEGALEGDVTIPASVDGYASYVLKFNALCDQNAVTSLILPDNMVVLHENAITYMASLQSITLNDGLEVICANNFNHCPALTSVTIPASVRLISNSFGHCDNLKEIRFTGVCPIFAETDFCFNWLPDDYVIYVPDDQFDAYAAALANTYDGVVDHLQPSGQNAVIYETTAADDWFSFDASTGTITGYTQYHAFVEIPESIGGVAVKAIADDAMHNNHHLFGIVLPEGLESVGKAAFYNAENLIYVSLPSTLKVVDDDAFHDIAGNRIDWSEGLETIGARAFRRTRLTTLTLPPQ